MHVFLTSALLGGDWSASPGPNVIRSTDFAVLFLRFSQFLEVNTAVGVEWQDGSK
jgi:hypothetical protein